MSGTQPYDPEPDFMEDEATCDHCWGEGYYHDCGEDTCCCARPELDELWPCENCGGTGYLR